MTGCKLVAIAALVGGIALPLQAAVSLQWTEQGIPRPGLRSFVLVVEANNGTAIAAVRQLSLTSVHQVFPFNGASPFQRDTESEFSNATWPAVDSHLLNLPPVDPRGFFFTGFRETHDSTNPTDIGLRPDDPRYDYPELYGSAGVGTLELVVQNIPPNTDIEPGVAFLDPLPATLPLLQIVVLDGQPGYLNVILEDSHQQLWAFRNVPIPRGTIVPEPAGVCMLGFASVCMLACVRSKTSPVAGGRARLEPAAPVF